MAKGQRLKPEQIVTLLRQIDILTTNFGMGRYIVYRFRLPQYFFRDDQQNQPFSHS